MKRKMNFATLIILLITSLFFVGCSGDIKTTSNNVNNSSNSDVKNSETNGNSSKDIKETKDSDYPGKPITVVVGYGPGGGQDRYQRIVNSVIQSYLGQPMIIKNREGAGGAIGTAEVAQAKPDGYTILSAYSSHMVVSPWVNNVPYTLDDFEPVVQMTETASFMVAGAEAPVKTWDELVAYAKENPGKLKYGVDGAGGASHLWAERIFDELGIKLTVVPTGGAADTLAQILGGHIDLGIATISTFLPSIEEGTIVGILSSLPESMVETPDVPGMRKIGYENLASSNWRGIFAPKGTPESVLNKLEEAFQKSLEDPSFVSLSEKISEPAVFLSREEFSKKIQLQYENYGVVIKKLNLGKK
jgi:tripartite-type tricarboxylate transporter receptor subunit TctC